MSVTNIQPLGELRFNRADSAKETNVSDMLATFQARVDRGDLLPEHMMILYVSKGDDGELQTGWAQAGPFNKYEIRGLLSTVLLLTGPS